MENSSCANCNARPIIRERKLTISRIKKLKKDLRALCCRRHYCPVGMYKTVFRCPSCGWKSDFNLLH